MLVREGPKTEPYRERGWGVTGRDPDWAEGLFEPCDCLCRDVDEDVCRGWRSSFER